MKHIIKKYIKDNWPDFTIWTNDDNNLISIRKIYPDAVHIPVKLIIDLMYNCKISYNKINICVENTTIPNNYNSLVLSINIVL